MNEIAATTDKEQSLLAPTNFDHAMKVSEFISKSDLVPKNMKGKPADILLAMEYGRRLGLGELQAIQNIAVINGKPSLFGDAVMAVCQAHPECHGIDEQPIKDSEGTTIGYTCCVLRHGYEPVIREFTITDAKKAGLWGKAGPWTSYPIRMIQMRARSWALRDTFADALSGVQVREEVEDYHIKDVTPRRQKANDLLAKALPTLHITNAQVEIISGLFAEKELAPERITKALSQFGVDNILKLKKDDADTLISQLNLIG